MREEEKVGEGARANRLAHPSLTLFFGDQKKLSLVQEKGTRFLFQNGKVRPSHHRLLPGRTLVSTAWLDEENEREERKSTLDDRSSSEHEKKNGVDDDADHSSHPVGHSGLVPALARRLIPDVTSISSSEKNEMRRLWSSVSAIPRKKTASMGSPIGALWRFFSLDGSLPSKLLFTLSLSKLRISGSKSSTPSRLSGRAPSPWASWERTRWSWVRRENVFFFFGRH